MENSMPESDVKETGNKQSLSMKALSAQLEQLQMQVLEQATENADLKEQLTKLDPNGAIEGDDLREELRQLKLEVSAVRAQSATADQILRFSEQVLDRIEIEKRRGGANHWVIKNKYFKNRQGEPARHDMWSNAETPREAIEDFKRRTGAQHDASDKRGDPFEAERADLPVQEVAIV